MNDDGDNSASLAESLNKLAGTPAAKAKKLRGFVVFANSDPDKLAKLAADKKIENVNVAYLKDGKDCSQRSLNVVEIYKLNPEAKNTIIVYKEGKVVANFVNLDANDFGKVEEAVKKMLQ